MRSIFILILLISLLCFYVGYSIVLLAHNIPLNYELDRLDKISNEITKNGFNLSPEDQKKFNDNTDEFIKVDKQFWNYGYPIWK